MSLAETHPHLAAQWHPDNEKGPESYTAGSGFKAKWKCPCCGCEFIATPSHRTDGRLSLGCSTCNRTYSGFLRRKPKTFEESLEYLEPELSKQWHPSENKVCGMQVYPRDFTIESHFEATWVCPNPCEYGCEHKWTANIRRRCNRGDGCPWCSNKTICKHQSFAWIFQELYEKLWDKNNKICGFNVTPKSGKKALFSCLNCNKSGLLKVISSVSYGHVLCKKCGEEKCKKSITKQHDIFIIQVNEKYSGDYEVVGGIYVNNKHPLLFRCNKHNVIFHYRPDRFLRGHIGCPKCQPCGWSKAAKEWIESIEASEGKHIQHMPREPEKVIGGLKVDGWCEETQTIYEFHGDYWHGNPRKYQWRMDEVNMSNGKTFGQLYDETVKKTQYLRSLGYRVIEKWETEFTS